jgi:hypothetical protein
MLQKNRLKLGIKCLRVFYLIYSYNDVDTYKD